MKNLIIIILAFVTLSCSQQVEPTPVYTSIEGVWKYSGPVSAGTFKIVKVSPIQVYSYFGSIEVNGLELPVDKTIVSAGQILLLSESNNYGIRIESYRVSPDYTEITADSYSVISGGVETVVNEGITIVRK